MVIMAKHSPPIDLSESEVKYIDTTPKNGRGRPSSTPEETEELIHIPELEEWDPRELPDHFFMVLEGESRHLRNGYSSTMRILFSGVGYESDSGFKLLAAICRE